MRNPDPHKADPLPGNHGQFGQSISTEDYKPLMATQRVRVRPVIPRSHQAEAGSTTPDTSDPADDKSEAHPS